MVICDCQPASTSAGAAAWEGQIERAQAGGMAALVEPTVARWFRPATLQTGGADLALVRDMIAHTPREGFIRALRALQSYDLRDAVAALQIPALFVVGADDAALPAAMRAMAEASGGAFTETPECGHLPNIERPAAFRAALAAFLPSRS